MKPASSTAPATCGWKTAHSRSRAPARCSWRCGPPASATPISASTRAREGPSRRHPRARAGGRHRCLGEGVEGFGRGRKSPSALFWRAAPASSAAAATATAVPSESPWLRGGRRPGRVHARPRGAAAPGPRLPAATGPPSHTRHPHRARGLRPQLPGDVPGGSRQLAGRGGAGPMGLLHVMLARQMEPAPSSPRSSWMSAWPRPPLRC